MFVLQEFFIQKECWWYFCFGSSQCNCPLPFRKHMFSNIKEIYVLIKISHQFKSRFQRWRFSRLLRSSVTFFVWIRKFYGYHADLCDNFDKMKVRLIVISLLLILPTEIQSKKSNSNRPTYFGDGLVKFFFGPYPKPLQNGYGHRPGYGYHGYRTTSPKPDFEKDKLPDYDLYLLGRKRRRRRFNDY